MSGSKISVGFKESLELAVFPPPTTKVCGWDLGKQAKEKRSGSKKAKIVSGRLYRHGLPRPRGVHDYHNLGWDPCIYRGRTFKDFRAKNFPPFSTTVNFNNYCCTEKCGLPEVAPRKQKRVVPKFKVGGIVRPTTDDILDEETGHRRHKQDEFRKEIEPFAIEQVTPPIYKEMSTQADDLRSKEPTKCAPIASGKSVSTFANICICGSGHKDDPMKPILDTMGFKVLEQSLLECSEEYELQRIRAELSKYMERRRIRQSKQMKLVERELFKAELEVRERARRDRELKEELEASQAIEAITFSLVLLNKVMNHTFERLRAVGLLEHEGDVVRNQVEALLGRQVGIEIAVPKMVLDDIIHNVESEKLVDYAELASAVYIETEGKFMGAEEIGETYEAPPTTENNVSSEGEEGDDLFDSTALFT